MNGEQLLEALLNLTPEQRKLPVVACGDDRWYYDQHCLNLECINNGREDDEGELNCIALS